MRTSKPSNERLLDHVGIAVPSIDDAIPTWAALVGRPATGRETLADQGVEVVFIGSGPGRIELLTPTRADSPVARFLEHRGPGLHHLCYRVADIQAALAECRAAGFELIDERPREGAHGHRVAFVHPRSTGGVLIEFLERADAEDAGRGSAKPSPSP
ncbi:MAG: methylmalonyl-CoA epimerase [Gemmatimonadota bacterium]